MPGHPVEDRGDTRRHLEAGADVVVGVGSDRILFKVSRGGGLKEALEELRASGVEFAIVEGFKTSGLPKIVLGGIEVDNLLRRVDASPPFDEGLIEELIGLLILQPES
jgi:molybdopterin synthase catalytic subunit